MRLNHTGVMDLLTYKFLAALLFGGYRGMHVCGA
jgi:hypothetical protein